MDSDWLLTKVSIIIPTYNRAHVIRRSIESALRQTHQDFEILIVDDGSTDETFNVVKPLLWDPRVRYFRHENNRGHQAARNTGIKSASGDYIAFLDSDDMWIPQKLELQLRTLNEAPVTSVALTGLWRVAENAPAEKYIKKYDGYVLPAMLAAIGPSFPCLLAPIECFRQIGLLDEGALALEDWDTCISLAKLYEFVTLNEPCTIVFTDEPDSVTRNKLTNALGYEYVVEKHHDDMLRFIGKRGLARHHKSIAFSFADAGEFNRCRAHILRAFKLDDINLEIFLLAFSALLGRRAFQLARLIGTVIKKNVQKLTRSSAVHRSEHDRETPQ